MIRWLKFKWRWLKWWLGWPGYRIGDTRMDRQSKNLIRERYRENEPKWKGEDQ